MATAPDKMNHLRASVPLWFPPSQKLTKTDRKPPGVKIPAVLHQQLPQTKTERPVSFDLTNSNGKEL
jgi:hypothetical protein